MEKNRKHIGPWIFLGGLALLLVLTLVFGIRSILAHKDFSGATGTLSMLALSGIDGIPDIERFPDIGDSLDLSKRERDELWVDYEDTRRPSCVVLYDIQSVKKTFVGAKGLAELSFSGELQAFTGVLDDPEGLHRICSFSVVPGEKEFKKELQIADTLYSNDEASVTSPLILGDSLYFMEGGNSGSSLYRYSLSDRTKEKLMENVTLSYAVGSTADAYYLTEDAYYSTGEPGKVYQKKLSDVEADPVVEENTYLTGTSSTGRYALLSDEAGRHLTVFDCDTGKHLSQLECDASWGTYRHAAISPDGRYLAAAFSVESGYQTRLINCETGTSLIIFSEFPDTFYPSSLVWTESSPF